MNRSAPAPCVVIDTNVLVVAEGSHPAASTACRAACIDLARRVEAGLVVALDSGDEIVLEYLGALRGMGTSGLGAKIARKLYRMRRNPEFCRQVVIAGIDEPPGSYAEVPEPLRDFDCDDQKFIAVAAAEGTCPQVHTAVDAEWWARRKDFVDCGIDVQFVCAGDFLYRERGLNRR